VQSVYVSRNIIRKGKKKDKNDNQKIKARRKEIKGREKGRG
jgi:hypothetical protein